MSVPAFVQSASVQGKPVASVTIAPITTTSGNFLVAMAARESAVAWTSSAVSDNHGNIWTMAWVDANTGSLFGGGALFYAQNIVGGTGHTVTLTLPSGTMGLALAVGEFTNVATTFALNNTAHTTNEAIHGGPSHPPIMSGTLTGVAQDQLLIGSATVSHGAQLAASVGLYTDAYYASNGPTEGVLFSYAIVNAAGAYHFAASNMGAAVPVEGFGLATFKGTAIANVQTTGVNAGLVASVTTPAITTTSGHCLIAVCSLYTRTFSGSPVTDTYGNTWQLAWLANTGAEGHAACYYAENITGGAGHTVTLTPPGGTAFCAIGVGEFSGINTTGSLDKTASASGATRPFNTGNTATTSQAHELLVGGISQSSGGVCPFSTVPLGWTTVESLGADIPVANGEGLLLAYQIAPADGTYEYGMSTGIVGATAFEAVGIASFLPGTPTPFVPPTTTTVQIRRMRRAPHLNQEHKRITYSQFEILAQVGTGLISGQGVDPQVMLRWSDDGGMTWSREHWTTLGAMGEYRTRVKWNRLGQARDRVFEVVVSDPVQCELISAYLDANVGSS